MSVVSLTFEVYNGKKMYDIITSISYGGLRWRNYFII